MLSCLPNVIHMFPPRTPIRRPSSFNLPSSPNALVCVRVRVELLPFCCILLCTLIGKLNLCAAGNGKNSGRELGRTSIDFVMSGVEEWRGGHCRVHGLWALDAHKILSFWHHINCFSHKFPCILHSAGLSGGKGLIPQPSCHSVILLFAQCPSASHPLSPYSISMSQKINPLLDLLLHAFNGDNNQWFTLKTNDSPGIRPPPAPPLAPLAWEPACASRDHGHVAASWWWWTWAWGSPVHPARHRSSGPCTSRR